MLGKNTEWRTPWSSRYLGKRRHRVVRGHMLPCLFVELHRCVVCLQEVQILRTDDRTPVVVAVERNAHHDMAKSLFLIILLRQMKILANGALAEEELTGRANH